MPDKKQTSGLLDSLEQDLTQQVQEDAAEESRTLRELLVDPVPETTPVFERAIVMTVGFLLLAGFLVVGLSFTAGRLLDPEDVVSKGATLGVLALELAVLAFIAHKLFKLWSNYKNPLYTLSLAGVQFRGREEPLPWTLIDDYIVHTSSYNGFTVSVYTKFTLAPDSGFEWPQVKTYGLKYRPKKNLIAAGGLGSSPRPSKLAKIIGRYREQAYARARLAELGENV